MNYSYLVDAYHDSILQAYQDELEKQLKPSIARRKKNTREQKARRRHKGNIKPSNIKTDNDYDLPF